MSDNLRSVVCNECGHGFLSCAEIKNIRCPECKSNKSLSITDNGFHRDAEPKKWNDYVIDAEGDPNPDGSGEVDMVEQGFACPDCGSLLPPLSDQGIAGCSICMSIWRRNGDDLESVDEDDVVAAKTDNL